MTVFVPIAMFGWLIVAMAAFRKLPPTDAAILVVFGGTLFLPMYSFDLPLIPEYNKVAAIGWSLILGEAASGRKKDFPMNRSAYDLPMILLCFISPMATSLSNGLGLYNGLSNTATNFLDWGIFYWIGRRYFADDASMKRLALAIVIGGLVYLPLIVFEVRMSPQLCRMIYGFFPHSFVQHIRYGGFRPIVFMQHGLMVALWAAVSAVAAYWLWRSKEVQKLRNVPMALITLALIGATVLCKSAGALVFLGLGIALYSVFHRRGSPACLRIVLLLPFVYVALRLSNVLPISTLEQYLSRYFDPERVASAITRFTEEDLFGARAMLRPWLGWGGYQRGWPIDPETGFQLISIVDAMWTIVFSGSGFVGLASTFLSLGIGPWMVLRDHAKARRSGAATPSSIYGIIVSLVVILFMLDCLMNAMHNPVYIMCAGALVSHSLYNRGASVPALAPSATEPPPGAATMSV